MYPYVLTKNMTNTKSDLCGVSHRHNHDKKGYYIHSKTLPKYGVILLLYNYVCKFLLYFSTLYYILILISEKKFHIITLKRAVSLDFQQYISVI